MCLIFQAAAKAKQESSDSDSDSDDEPAAKKVAVTPKPVVKAAPQKKQSNSSDSDSSEEETTKSTPKSVAKPAATPQNKVNYSFIRTTFFR